MLTGVYQAVAILVVCIVYYITDVQLMRLYNPLRERSSRNWGYTAVVLIFFVFTISQPIIWPGLGLRTDAWWGLAAQALGAVLTAGGLILNWWARSNLRQFFYEGVELQPEHRLVDSGPYAYIRHPIYTASFLIGIGAVLINPAITTLTATIYAFALFIPMSKREEKLLSESVAGYADYMTRTSRFSPIFRKRSGDK